MSDPAANFVVAARDTSAAAFKSAEENLRSYERAARTVTKTLTLLTAGFSIGEITKAADAWKKSDNILRGLTSATGQQAQVEARLFDVAQRTGVSYTELVQKYFDAGEAAKKSGDNQSRAMEAVITAAEKQGRAIDGTIGAATERLENSLTRLIGKWSEASSAGSIFGSVIERVQRTVDALNPEALQNMFDTQQIINARAEVDRLTKSVESLSAGGGSGEGFFTDQSFGEWLLGGFLAGGGSSDANSLDGVNERLATAKKRLDDLVRPLREIEVTAKRLPPIAPDKNADLTGVQSTAQKAFHNPIDDVLAEQKAAADAKLAQQRTQLQAELEQVRQASLSQEDAERDAVERRLEILRNSYDAGLIDQERYYELSADVAQRGQDRLYDITRRAVDADRRLNAQKIGNVRGLNSAIAAALTAGGENSKKEFEQHKKIAIAAAIVDTAAAAVLALRSGPPPGNFIAAAAVAAAGYAQVRNIRSTTWNGGSEASGGGGAGGSAAGAGGGEASGGSAPTFPDRSAARSAPILHVEVHGNIVGAGGRDELGQFLTELLSDYSQRTDDVIVTTRTDPPGD